MTEKEYEKQLKNKGDFDEIVDSWKAYQYIRQQAILLFDESEEAVISFLYNNLPGGQNE